MDTYNPPQSREKIKQIMDTEYERMYPFEIEQELSPLFKLAEENKDELIKQEILWEIDLINRAFGYKGTYEGKEVTEISNKWQYFLESREFKPFSNTPFCEWKKEAVDYYKKRYKQTVSSLAKARYAFAVMVFSSGKDKLDWMLKSVENWQKCAEKYVSEGKYNQDYYEVPPFAYEFALKLSLSFRKQDIARKVLDSLHKTINTVLEAGEKRWHLEFLEVESKYVNLLDNIDALKKESTENLKQIIQRLEKEFDESPDKQKSNHFIRSHLSILLNYKTENEYDLNKKIAESHISEAEARDEPFVKSSFFNDAIKKYKEMQSRFSDRKDEIQEKIDELILKIKEINSKITYKKIQTKIEITKEQTDAYLAHLKAQKKDLLIAFLDDASLLPEYEYTKKMCEDQKKQYPLQFMIPIMVYNAEEPIMRITSEADIFDHQVRRNILLGLKIGEIMCKITFELLKKELGDDDFKTIELLISQNEIKDIKPTLETGFNYIFGEKKDLIAGLHILTPYIEEIIRLIIKKSGKVEVVLEQHKTKFFRCIELGGLLSDKNVEELIGIDFQKSLKVMLVDNDQANIRNELLHGRLNSDKISEGQTLFLAYCLLKLIKILKDTDKK
jgi:Uri superfamily endonuclease